MPVSFAPSAPAAQSPPSDAARATTTAAVRAPPAAASRKPVASTSERPAAQATDSVWIGCSGEEQPGGQRAEARRRRRRHRAVAERAGRGARRGQRVRHDDGEVIGERSVAADGAVEQIGRDGQRAVVVGAELRDVARRREDVADGAEDDQLTREDDRVVPDEAVAAGCWRRPAEQPGRRPVAPATASARGAPRAAGSATRSAWRCGVSSPPCSARGGSGRRGRAAAPRAGALRAARPCHATRPTRRRPTLGDHDLDELLGVEVGSARRAGRPRWSPR